MIYQSPRSTELKRKMAAAMTSAVVDIYELKPEQVHVYFHEADSESWAKAGVLAADQPPATA
jgi:phenylpyruvate tautomerase PptA (4-oxalocrotonate tautomerase family)